MKSSAQNKIRSISYAKYGYYFILPFFIVYFIFSLVPLINTFRLSVYGNAGNMDTFVGLENFKTILFGGEDFKSKGIHETVFRDFGNTLILWFGNFIPQLALSLLLAVWFTDLNLKIKGKTFFKIVMYLPNIVTAASVAALFTMLFSKTKFGPINSLLLDMKLIDEPINFLKGQWQSRGVIMFAQTWMWFGNTMIMLMAAIMGISPSLFEAADIDGANSRQVFTKITLPLLKPMVVYTMITSMIGGLQMWDLPYLYKDGATATNRFTETIAVYIFDAFHKSPYNYGNSAAASVILFVITSVLGSICFAMNIDKEAQKKKKMIKEAKKLAKLQNKSAFGGF